MDCNKSIIHKLLGIWRPMGNKFGLRSNFSIMLSFSFCFVIGKSCITLFPLLDIELFESMNKRNMIGTHMALSMLINHLCQSILVQMEETMWFFEKSVISTNSIRTLMVSTTWLLQQESGSSWASVLDKMWPWVIGKESQTNSVQNQIVLTLPTFSSANGFFFPFLQLLTIFQLVLSLMRYLVLNLSE